MPTSGAGTESMFSVVLGVAIGVVFLFTIFSVFVSTVVEAVSSLFKLRGRALLNAIAQLIGDPAFMPRHGGFGLVDAMLAKLPRAADAQAAADTRAAGLVADPAAPLAESAVLVADPVDPDRIEAHEAATESEGGDYAAPATVRFEDVFRHPLVAGPRPDFRTSYVPAGNFALALIHALDGGGPAGAGIDTLRQRIATLPAGQLRIALQTALADAPADLDGFRKGIERWYEQAMNRLSGEYKRFTQLVTFVVGLAFACTLSIDSIDIARHLYVDPLLRTALEQQATQYVAAVGRPAGQADADMSFDKQMLAVKEARARLQTALSPFGASDEAGTLPATASGSWLLKLLGYTITALAGMLGAAFWFDLLQKLVNLRGTGPKVQAGQQPPQEKAA